MFQKPSTITIILAITIFGFLAVAETVSAVDCIKPPGWNSGNQDCDIEVTYQDPVPGSGLESCFYGIGSKIGEPDIYDMPAFTSVDCNGMASTTAIIIMEIGVGKACYAIGEGACKIETQAYDIAGNFVANSQTYNISAYNLNVSSSPVSGILINSVPSAYGSTTNYQILNIAFNTNIELTAPLTYIDGGTTYYFENWTGDCDSVSGPESETCELTMIIDKAVVANFIAGPYQPDNLQESWNNCWGGVPYVAPGVNLTLRWHYDHPQGRNQAAYEIWISDLAGIFAATTSPGSVAPGSTYSYVLNLDNFGNWKNSQCNHSVEYLFGDGLCWNSRYQWRVKAQDDQGNWSVWSDVKVTDPTPWHAWPNPDFSWQPATVMVDEVIQFIDESKAYGGATTTAWQWQFQNGSPPVSNNKNPTTTFSVATTTNRIDLEVWDDTGYHCPTYKDINITFPLPDYKEVAPIGRLDNFLARIINIFR